MTSIVTMRESRVRTNPFTSYNPNKRDSHSFTDPPVIDEVKTNSEEIVKRFVFVFYVFVVFAPILIYLFAGTCVRRLQYQIFGQCFNKSNIFR